MAFNFKHVLAGLFATVLATAAAPAIALDLTNVAFIQTVAGTTSIPVGHLEFCKARANECRAYDSVLDAMPLNDANWQQLVSINAHFNQTILPVTDKDLYGVEEFWTYPTGGYGDCEDYALAKRSALISAGWHPSTLMIAVVRQQNGDGHAVLIARTDRGDLVLDNQDGTIRLWSDTPYHYIKRQSQAHAGQWVDMIDNRQIVVANLR